MAETVIQYVLRRLKEIGVDDVFGVAGDYAFPVNDAIVEDPSLSWISCCNELNAAYAADGYARTRGVAALCTTFGVGEAFHVGETPSSLAVGNGGLWAVVGAFAYNRRFRPARLVRVNPAGGQTTPLRVGRNLSLAAIAVGGGATWVAVSAAG